MPFQPTQLGRFGELGMMLSSSPDPDSHAAELYAADGIVQRPTLQQVLASKGFWHPDDQLWRQWQNDFGALRNLYLGRGGRPLMARCNIHYLGLPPGACGHEFVPPLWHWNLQGFSQQLSGLPNNTVVQPDGTVKVNEAVPPVWLYIVTVSGEILVCAEAYDLIKHTSLAAGQQVWAAGQLGIEGQRIRVADLQSGHYINRNLGPSSSTNLARELVGFVREVFRQYTQRLNVAACLHAQFDCAWI